MDDDKRVAQGIEQVLSSPEFMDIAETLGEIALDAVSQREWAREFPIVSTLFGIVEAAGKVREHFLRRKLAIFLREASRATARERRLIFREVFGDDRARRSLCMLLLHLVDEMRDEERVRHVGSLFVALLTGDLSEPEFRRLCEVVRTIEKSHLALLSALNEQTPKLVSEAEITFLVLHALATPDYTPHSDGSGVRFVRTLLGTKLLGGLAVPAER